MAGASSIAAFPFASVVREPLSQSFPPRYPHLHTNLRLRLPLQNHALHHQNHLHQTLLALVEALQAENSASIATVVFKLVGVEQLALAGSAEQQVSIAMASIEQEPAFELPASSSPQATSKAQLCHPPHPHLPLSPHPQYSSMHSS